MNFKDFFKSKYRTLAGRVITTSRVCSYNPIRRSEIPHNTSKVRSESNDIAKKLMISSEMMALLEGFGPFEILEEGNEGGRTEES